MKSFKNVLEGSQDRTESVLYAVIQVKSFEFLD